MLATVNYLEISLFNLAILRQPCMIMMMMMMVLIRNTKDDHGRDILVNQECLTGFANIDPFTDPCLSLKLYNKPQ